MQERLESNKAKAPRQFKILAILHSAGTCEALEHIFSVRKWSLFTANNLRDGIVIVDREPVTVAITEASLPDGTWQDLVTHLQEFQIPPRLIVASPLTDERVWAEALNLGAHDILALPFNFNEVIRVVELALGSWKQDWEDARRRTRRAGGA